MSTANVERNPIDTASVIVIAQNQEAARGSRARRASHARRSDSAASPVAGIATAPKNQKSGLVARIPAAIQPPSSPATSRPRSHARNSASPLASADTIASDFGGSWTTASTAEASPT
jgi:hypothetical protein